MRCALRSPTWHAALLSDVAAYHYTPAVPSASDAALDCLRDRTRLPATLERVDAAIRAWDEWQANQHLPLDLRRNLRKPEVGRIALNGLHWMLVEELERLEQEWGRRN